MKPKILIIYTGGTIGMTVNPKTKALQAFDFDDIYSKIPELKLLEYELFTVSFDQPIDSSDINREHILYISQVIEENYYTYDGFVVLHGTDTMSYTASALSFLIDGLQKPIIFTGSQLPMGDLRTDSKENLITSIYYAGLQENEKPVIREVCIYFEYKLFRANKTTKFSSSQFDAFFSNSFPILGESGVHLKLNKELLWNDNQDLQFHKEMSNSFDYFRFIPGQSLQLLEYCIHSSPARLLFLDTYGSGNIPGDTATMDLLYSIQDKDKIAIVLSQCVNGVVQLGKYQNSQVFIEIGAISGFSMSHESALTKSMVLMSQYDDKEDFTIHYNQNTKGELSTF